MKTYKTPVVPDVKYSFAEAHGFNDAELAARIAQRGIRRERRLEFDAFCRTLTNNNDNTLTHTYPGKH